ncbi:12682_t:CDS:2 [Acaulospora morrowiae]|uniref:12682_t:CDS:1 n=1 Tax=Acaulospora morrowiae TaxID=94023 RepID=A0A9N8VD12_9GLOM|nr:12682_t:CDS:2 [Acaulospora morrowiae]
MKNKKKLSQISDSTRDDKNHEQLETRRVADHISKRRRRDAETLHERELRLANERESRRKKRALETTDQRKDELPDEHLNLQDNI